MRRGLIIALGVCCGCALKPLRFVDASDGSSSLIDQMSSETSIDSLQPLDTLETDASDTSADHVAIDGAFASAPGPSCQRNGNSQDCRVVLIGASESFCIGTNDAMRATDNNTPALCGLRLSAFAIDATEVSVARFARFRAEWEAGRLPATQSIRYPNGVTLQATLPLIGDTTEQSVGIGCNYRFASPAMRGEHPMNCVSLNLAQYFCAWTQGRLPTNAEYEYVARWWGTGGLERQFPWGQDAPSCTYANYGGCAGDDGSATRRIANTPMGAVLNQVFDMGGNVGEWIADDLINYSSLAGMPCWLNSLRDPLCAHVGGGVALSRGGGYSNLRPTLGTVFRGRDMSTADPSRGFRCVYSR